LEIEETYLKGCFILKPKVFYDHRGFFYESFNARNFETLTGEENSFVQDNISVSKKGVLRGLHFQKGTHSQAKLISVLKGAVMDVVVDLRQSSPSFGKYYKIILDEKDKFQLFVPKGFAHGFLTLTEEAVFSYKCDAYYNKESESGICYNDKTLAIDWEFPESEIILSDKDRALGTLEEILSE
jgi:dTDP-4-dehydrorhamnose 3,5-epimerase